ncbi:MAG TPA: hypothetical protein VF192_08675 [Longimicrobiales bacterium]
MATRPNQPPEYPREFGAGSEGMPGRESFQEPTKAETERGGEGMREKARGMGEKVKERAGSAIETGKEKLASGVDRLGTRLEERARPMEEKGGVKGMVGGAVHGVGGALESSAEYLRTHEMGTIRDDLKSQIREHPFASVGIALGTGFVLGRVFGGGEEEEEEEHLEAPRMRRGVREEGGEGFFRQMRRPLGRAIASGATAMLARQVRNRIGGRARQRPC